MDQSKALSGKVIVITGAGRGMGRKVTLFCAREAAAVVPNDLGVSIGGDHPIRASGLRMLYENCLQLLDRAGERQRSTPPEFAVTRNLGGMPNQNVAAVSVVGLHKS